MNAERLARIEQRLRAAFAPERLVLADRSRLHEGHREAGRGGHYDLTIVSARFDGRDAVQRHRMIYDALRELMGTEIHALRIEAYAPGEFPHKG